MDSPADKGSTSVTPRQKRRSSRRGIVFQVAILIALVFLYAAKPDWATALWYWPAWFWAALFVLLALPSIAFRRFRVWALSVILWGTFALAFDDMARGAVRSLLPGGENPNGSFTVASFNCAGGSVEAAKEALESGAELVLLQESPSQKELERLAKEKWGDKGSAIWGPDCSILATGELENLGLLGLTVPKGNFAWASWIREGGQRCFVGSLRLQPPVFRLDYWNPDCWRAYAEDRARRKAELDEVLHIIDGLALEPGLPIILAGDFNGPPSEDFQGSLQKLCLDSYAEAGRGWGGTGTNDFPFVRFDQVWHSPGLRAVTCTTHKSANSDHRLVLAEFEP